MDDQRSDSPEEPVTIRDNRKIDPSTGEVRVDRTPPATDPTQGVGDGSEGLEAELAGLAADAGEAKVAELTADVQRVQAEYANYRKRVDRDRDLARENERVSVMAAFLPVLDDIGRAREHGDLDGPFKAVGEALEGVVSRLGLERFGDVGDVFDPTVHEALMHETADDVDVSTCINVYQPGYRIGERLVRPARVVVADPA